METWLIIAAGSVILCVIFGFLCNSLARAKGYDDYFWHGFFLNILALIYVAGLPPKGYKSLALRIAAANRLTDEELEAELSVAGIVPKKTDG